MNQGSDNGTPTQKDEPQAQNAPNGATIDYYLKSAATGPVSIEILDAGGACLAIFTNASAGVIPIAPQVDAVVAAAGARGGGGGGIPNTSALWRPAPEPFATDAGMHRLVRGRPAGAAAVSAAEARRRRRPWARSRRSSRSTDKHSPRRSRSSPIRGLFVNRDS